MHEDFSIDGIETKEKDKKKANAEIENKMIVNLRDEIKDVENKLEISSIKSEFCVKI